MNGNYNMQGAVMTLVLIGYLLGIYCRCFCGWFNARYE